MQGASCLCVCSAFFSVFVHFLLLMSISQSLSLSCVHTQNPLLLNPPRLLFFRLFLFVFFFSFPPPSSFSSVDPPKPPPPPPPSSFVFVLLCLVSIRSHRLKGWGPLIPPGDNERLRVFAGKLSMGCVCAVLHAVVLCVTVYASTSSGNLTSVLLSLFTFVHFW